LSNLAEYARSLHEADRQDHPRILKPRAQKGREERLKGVRAVIFDVYGTLINYWKPGFEDRSTRENLLLAAFGEMSKRFGMDDTLAKINPQDPPAKTLNDFYSGLITLNHQKSVEKGVEMPEVRVEEVWAMILMILKRNGYDVNQPSLPPSADLADFSRRLAYTYNFVSMGRSLYPGVSAALKKLKDDNMVLGILSDAQLYTPIDLTLLLRDQSGGVIEDYNELFDTDLTFFSCEYGFVKPSEILYRRLFDALYEYHITPSQTVFIGNDLMMDICPAASIGMKTGLFCGDDVMVFGDGDNENVGADVVPDIIFNSWTELPKLISFHGEMDDARKDEL
jgi:putative hydrolase of the HAD superfamily